MINLRLDFLRVGRFQLKGRPVFGVNPGIRGPRHIGGGGLRVAGRPGQANPHVKEQRIAINRIIKHFRVWERR